MFDNQYIALTMHLTMLIAHPYLNLASSQRLALLAKVTVFGPKKWHFKWPNQNSKTTFIVQTFPKYGPYDFYFMNSSLLGVTFGHISILLIFGLIVKLGISVKRDGAVSQETNSRI